MSWMPQLNLYSAPVLLAAVLNICLLITVLYRLSPGPVQRAFVLWDLVLAVWNLGVFGIFSAPTESVALYWNRLAYAGIVWIPAVFLHLVLTVQGHRRPWQRVLNITLAAAGGLLLIGEMAVPGFLAKGVRFLGWGYVPLGGPGTAILDPLLGASAVYSLFLLFRATKTDAALNKTQLQYLLLGATVAFIGGGINVMVIHGAPIYPFGNLLNIVYSVCVSYAILSYSWVNLRTAFSQTLVYSTLCTLLSGLFVLMARGIEYLQTSHDGQVVLNAYALAVLPVLAMAPIVKSRLQYWIERWFFRDFAVLRAQIQEWGSVSHGLERLRRILGFPGSAIWAWDGHQFSPVAIAGVSAPSVDVLQGEVPELSRIAPSGICQTGELLWRQRVDPLWDPRWNPLVHWLQTQRVKLVLPLHSRGELKGLWLFGPASDTDRLPRVALRQLQRLSGQVADIVQQSRSATRALENSLMGTFAAELAHELARPLTHIQNEKSRLERRMPPDVAGASLQRISKEVQRATEILDSFSLLSPDRALHRLRIPLEDLMNESLESQSDLVRSVKIIRHFDPIASVEVNPGQIVQIFSNVIQNALQAMDGEGTLTVSVSDCSNADVCATVEDTGPGIPSNLQMRVFDAFFSTKKKQGGRGVGLSLSRAMAERHGGQMSIESPVADGRGTRIIIRLPRQNLMNAEGEK